MRSHFDFRTRRDRRAIGSVLASLLLACSFLCVAASAASKKEENKKKLEEVMSYDGLQKISVKGIDLAYTFPDATLAAYKKVRLDPIEVSFHKDWDPTRTGSVFKISASDREKIRTGVAKVVYEEFVKELQTKSTYQVVDETGPDVLRVKAVVANLYVNAPDVASAGRSRTYVSSAGEMTLIAELHDSESGQVLARVVDRQAARDYGTMRMNSSVFNVAEAKDIAANWARILRESLDRAHGIGKK
jgi:hypothetical protein